MFPSSYRNMSGSLGEREMLWEQQPRGKCSHSFFLCFYNSIEIYRTSFLFLLENTVTKKKKKKKFFFFLLKKNVKKKKKKKKTFLL